MLSNAEVNSLTNASTVWLRPSRRPAINFVSSQFVLKEIMNSSSQHRATIQIYCEHAHAEEGIFYLDLCRWVTWRILQQKHLIRGRPKLKKRASLESLLGVEINSESSLSFLQLYCCRSHSC